jgi:hypothetical protein
MAAKRQMASMENRAQLTFACIRTVLVLAFLIAGVLGQTIRQPQIVSSVQIVQMQNPLVHISSAADKERARMPRSVPAAAASGPADDDAVLQASAGQHALPVRRILLLAAPRAPPLSSSTIPLAYQSRAPPSDMI